MKKHPIWALLALMALCVPMVAATAQEALSEKELVRQPGYVDFGDIWKWSDGDEEIEIHLTQPLLGVVGAFAKSEDPELANLITNLHLVKVNGFSFGEKDANRVRDFVDGLADGLRKKGWDNIVKVRERDQRVNVFVKFEGDKKTQANTFLSGLSVLVFEDEGVKLVNVVGHFRLEDIAKVGAQFDIPIAEDWEKYDTRREAEKKEGGEQ